MSATTPTSHGDRDPDPGSLDSGRPIGSDPPVREVVVGTDGSECALRAVRWAAEEAARREAPLRIVHAADYLGRPGVDGAPPLELPRARQITAQAYTVARHTAPAVPASTEIVPGDAATALLRAAATAQLIVLGVSTTGAADEMVLAPVAQRVAALSPQPVAVVPRRRTDAAASRPLVAVLGLGAPDDDEPVAVFAAEAARRSGRSLKVLHTEPQPDRSGQWAADPAAWSDRFPDLEATHEPLRDVSGYRLVAVSCPTDLLIISAGHGGMLRRHLDALHRWLLRHCTSPMALLPPADRLAEGQRQEQEEAAAQG